MKKLILTAAMLSTTLAFSQQKQDSAKTENIQEVALTKKVFQKKADRLVYDVAATPNAKGSNAFDLLKETPLLSTTDDKSFTILGKSGSVIYINGRKSNMSADAVTSMLKTMPSDNIQRIEVITVPSSEFAVEGNQGIINIILKKKLSDGTSGNLKLEDVQNYYNSQNISSTINYRKGKFGASANVSFNNNKRMQDLQLENGNDNPTTYPNGQISDAFRQTSDGVVRSRDKDISGYLNLDYQINDRQNLGFSYSHETEFDSQNESNLLNHYTNLTANKGAITRTKNNSEDHSTDHSINLNYEIKTDDKGSKFSASASYLNHYKKENVLSNTSALDNSLNNLGTLSEFTQSIPLKIDNAGILLDYVKKLKNDYTLSAGASYNQTKTDSDTQFFNIVPPTGRDENQSNHFAYTEKIPSIYLTLEKNFADKWSTKAGLRFEKTIAEGNVLDKNIDFTRNNNNFLPYLNIGYTPNQNHNFSYSFSSRVQRPSFWSLTPTKIFLTETNYLQNNPFSKPEISYNQEFMYMLKSAYYINLSYEYVDNAASQLPLQGINSKGQNVLAYIRDNYGSKKQAVAAIGMQKAFYKGIWIANNSFYIGQLLYKGAIYKDPTDLTGEVKFSPNILDTSNTFFGLNLNNTIRLSDKKDLFLDINYMLNSGIMTELGKLGTFSSLGFSLKKIEKDWTFTLKVRDIFNTSKQNIAGIQNDGSYNNVHQNNNNRGVTLMATYNFGNSKIEKVRNIGGANDDLKSRTGGK